MGANELPEGTVTFLLSDVEGSTQAWETEPDDARRRLASGEALIAAVVAARGGVRPVEQGEGDSVVAAFVRPLDAVLAALDAQRGLTAEEADTPRVRIAVHTGEAMPRADGTYRSVTLHRAARIRSAAHGGQIVVSASTAALVAADLPGEVTLRPLGTHRLRDLAHPATLFQLVAPDLLDGFPPLWSLDTVSNNLPAQLTSMIGRERSLTELHAILDEHRLVTLTGSGGCGKTRLAMHLAAERDVDGVWFVDLGAADEADDVDVELLRAIGARQVTQRAAPDVAADHLAGRRALLILDNCEHVIDRCASVAAALLCNSPQLCLVATSREPLGVQGEVVYRVPSLEVPHADTAIEQLRDSAAVQLLVDRARLLRPAFDVTPGSAQAIGEICRRLDGIPLAIELAAAQLRAMSPVELASALDERFRLLRRGSRTALARQQTLQASVDWSHERLSAEQRMVFRRLAAFAAPFDLAAAAAVAGFGELNRDDVADVLTSLVDCSLVGVEVTDDESRHRLLETIRQYAESQMVAAGEVSTVRERHAAHFASVCRLAGPALEGPQLVQWVHRLSGERADLLAAFDWHLDEGEPAEAWAMYRALTFFFVIGGLLGDARQCFERCLLRADEVPPRAQLPARWGASYAALYAGEFERGAALASETLALAEQLGDTQYTARALDQLGSMLLHLDPHAASDVLARAIASAEDASDEWCRTDATQVLAYLHLTFNPQRHDEVLRLLDLVRPAAERMDNTALLGWDEIGRGWIDQLRGAHDTARAHFDDAIRHARRTADLNLEGFATAIRTITEIRQGRAAEWIPHLAELTERCHRLGAGQAIIPLMVQLRTAMVAAGDPRGAAGIARRLAELGDGDVPVSIYGPWLDAVEAIAGGRPDHATAAAAISAERARSLGADGFAVLAELAMGAAALIAGRLDAAERHVHRALPVLHDSAFLPDLADALAVLAATAHARGQHLEAARLWGAADRLSDELGVTYSLLRAATTLGRDDVTHAVGENLYDAAYREGRSLKVDDAVDYARRARGERKRPTSGWDSLTPTETRVVELAVTGLSNRHIAERLFIGAGTVKTHLAHVFAKLGVTNRTQLATEFGERARHDP